MSDAEGEAAPVPDEPEVDYGQPVKIPNILREDQIAKHLSQIEKTFDGSSQAFVNLDLEGKEIEDLGYELASYQNLRYINLNKNKLTSISNVIPKIPYLLTLTANNNQINTIDFFQTDRDALQFLQSADLSNNSIEVLCKISQPKLTSINLSNNKISNVERYEGHPALRTVNLVKNQLTTHIHSMPCLTELYLNDNKITDLSSLKDVPKLKKLVLRNNLIEKIEAVPELPSLEYLNLRQNKMAALDHVKELKSLESLTYLNMMESPLHEEQADGLKQELLILYHHTIKGLKMINKEEVEDEEVETAIATEKERIAEEEERIRQEEEAKRLAEAEAEGEKE